MLKQLDFHLTQGDIATVDADVLVLKYAQSFYGADEWMARTLATVGIAMSQLQPAIGQSVLIPTRGTIRAPYVLFVGMPPLRHFGYADIYEFGMNALAILAREKPEVQRIALTLHGIGFGLDETASFQAELAGVSAGWESGAVPPALQSVTLVERSANRVARLEGALSKYLSRASHDSIAASSDRRSAILLRPDNPLANGGEAATPEMRGSEVPTQTQPHAFVAMPFSDAMLDIFYYGIQTPLHEADLLCERMDHVAYTGVIIEHMKRRIETASLVIAILTGNNPNVYLEVGYAWGKGVPTLLVATSVEELAFDVHGNKCLTYTSIKDLEQKLRHEVSALQAGGQLAHRGG